MARTDTTSDRRRGVLLIEDDQALRETLARGLSYAGFLVRTADDETSALEAFERQKPAAVITDLILPSGEGMNIIKAMRAACPDLPIVLMSGGGFFSSERLLSLAKSFGADAALSKPFRMVDLVGCLSQLLAPQRAELAA